MKTFNNCTLYDIYKDDANQYNMPNYIINEYLSKSTFDLHYLRALPFLKLNENTWEIQKLPMSLLIQSIMFKNIYNFSLRLTPNSKYGKYIPYFIKDYKNKDGDDKKKDDDKSDNKSDNKDDEDDENKKLYDPYLVLCSLKKKHLDVDKFLEHLPIAYNETNFYPIVIYPKKITILNYNKINDTILFRKFLEPISNKHKLKLQ